MPNTIMNNGHQLITTDEEKLLRNDECLVSQNGKFKMTLQTDGNLVIYELPGMAVRWASGTHNQGVDALRLQFDGNLVLYKKGGKDAAWDSGTHGKGRGVKAVLENFGDLVMYDSQENIIWSSVEANSKNWMKDLDDQLTLKQICMPGSHDAGMYDTKFLIREGLAITQSKNLYDQLSSGVRYFDLRPRFILDKGYYVWHGPTDGPKIDVVLDDVKRFFKEVKTETVILNFTHFGDFALIQTNEVITKKLKERNMFTEENIRIYQREIYSNFTKLIKNKLGDCLLIVDKKKNLSKDLKLSDLRGKVIVLSDSDEMFDDMTGQPEGIYRLGTQLKIYDKYSNKQSYEEMLKDQREKFDKFDNQDELFLLNWTLTGLTPEQIEKLIKEKTGTSDSILDPMYWISKAASNLSALVQKSIESRADEVNKKLLEQFKNSVPSLWQRKADHKSIVNVINLDFVERARALAVCKYVMHQP